MSRIGILQIVIIALTITTALVHLWLAYEQLSIGMIGGVMFVLNGLGYLGLLAALYAPVPMTFVVKNRSLVRYVLIAFAVITIIAWLVMGEMSLRAYITKFIEVVLVVLLFFESRQKVTNP